MNFFIIFIFILFNTQFISSKIDSRSKCGSKLLDDVNLVPDSAFTASSFFVQPAKVDKQMDFSPKAARESYDKDNQDFAWCPKNKISESLNDYLEIDLGRLTVINFAQTKGRFAQGAGKEYSPFYKIEYRREEKDKWMKYKKIDKLMGFKELLKGPNDPFLDAYETLDPPIITRWIRIFPYSYELMRVCLKLQLFGCIFEDHIMEYRIHQGSELKNSFVKLPGILSSVLNLFQDSSFDGQNDQGLLMNGLGRLTDNKTGGHFVKDPLEAQHYVGWNRNDIGGSDEKSVTLWFRFDSVRNFSSVKLYIFENETLQIGQPKLLEAKFSLDGDTFSQKNAIISNSPEHKSDTFLESKSPWIEFNMQQNIGRFLQLKLYFQSEWILLSEVDIISELATGFDVKKPELSFIPTTQPVKTDSTFSDNSQIHSDSSVSIDAVYMLTILLCLLLGIILAITVFWLVMRHRRIKRKKDIKKHELAFYSQNPFKTLNMSPYNQGGFHLISNAYLSDYQPAQLAPRGSISTKPEPSLFSPILNSQNCMTLPKQSGQPNESSIYTSIPGSDNDSSIGTEYMVNSGVNSSHTYTQTVPLSSSIADFMLNQPQIIGNPLVELLDKPQYYGRTSNSGIYSYEPDLLAMTNSPHQTNLLNNNSQSFTGSGTYQPIDYSNSIDKTFFSIPNKYRSSPMKMDPLLR